MQDKNEFEVVGSVVRKFNSPSGKFAVLVVETSRGGYRSMHDMKTFEGDVCRQISTVGVGEVVRVFGELGREQLKNKAKEPVIVDERPVYVASLKVTKIESVTEKESAKDASDDVDGIPF